MLRVEFHSVSIKNFKSIGEANVSLSGQGIVKVLGINEYEANASSNGSGKSSIFMAIFWALYGKDPKGIANPSNRYTKGDCEVSVKFSVDLSNYQVTRRIHGNSQSCLLFINGEDNSARNRTDTDKMIKDDILKMSSDIFLSLIYLSQGFDNRLSALSPSARKDMLEQLTGTSKLVDDFNDLLSKRESQESDNKLKLLTDKSQNSGYLNSLNNVLDDLNKQLKDSESYIEYYEAADGKRYYRTDITKLQATIDAITKDIDDKRNELSELNRQNSVDKNKLDVAVRDIRQRQMSCEDAQVSMKELDKPTPSCPTCHQLLQNAKADELREHYKGIIEACKSAIAEIQSVESTYKSRIAETNSRIDVLSKYIEAHTKDRSQVTDIINHIPLDNKISPSDIKSRLEDAQSQITELESHIVEQDKLIVVSDTKIGVIKHCRQLVTKAFRSYLLESAISFLNNRLSVYSRQLFSGDADIVRFDSDSSRIDLYLGSALYDSLSGGEARKVDLAVVLAQRDLASEVAGTSCNMIVLDEIMESMDETATQVTLELLEKASQTVESMFIISHNNYAIPADSSLYVKKNSDRIANVYYSSR